MSLKPRGGRALGKEHRIVPLACNTGKNWTRHKGGHCSHWQVMFHWVSLLEPGCIPASYFLYVSLHCVQPTVQVSVSSGRFPKMS